MKHKGILWNVLSQNLSEEELYKSYFHQNFWTLDQFSALIVGLSPEKFHKLTKSKKKLPIKEKNKFFKALNIQKKFLKDVENKKITYFQFIEKDIGMSSWKFIKWSAENNISIIVKFFKCLPLYLMELLIEFQPMNTDLRLMPTHRREYHRAFYLKHAEELTYNNSMTNEQIFQHPKMQNVMRYIRNLGKNYRKSTVIKSWLPNLFPNREKGRPKKAKN